MRLCGTQGGFGQSFALPDLTHPENARAAGDLPSSDEVQLVLDEYKREDVGVLHTAMNLRKDVSISLFEVIFGRFGHNSGCQYMHVKTD